MVFLQVQTEGFERDLVDKETRRMVEVLLSSTRDIGLIIHGIVLQVIEDLVGILFFKRNISSGAQWN